jgi:hypothetical protein
MDAASTIRPEQIWLIEQRVATGLAALDRGALAAADVVLYDRALARWVARFLPAGGYAEPLLSDPGADDPAISPRAVKLASRRLERSSGSSSHAATGAAGCARPPRWGPGTGPGPCRSG